jgi:hypothetical protein
LVAVRDLKSLDRKVVRVRFPPQAPIINPLNQFIKIDF